MNKFWEATSIRALRTVCQTAISTIGCAVILTDVNWQYVISASLLAGILSVLTSIATGLPEVDGYYDFEEDDDESADDDNEEEVL